MLKKMTEYAWTVKYHASVTELIDFCFAKYFKPCSQSQLNLGESYTLRRLLIYSIKHHAITNT